MYNGFLESLMSLNFPLVPFLLLGFHLSQESFEGNSKNQSVSVKAIAWWVTRLPHCFFPVWLQRPTTKHSCVCEIRWIQFNKKQPASVYSMSSATKPINTIPHHRWHPLKSQAFHCAFVIDTLSQNHLNTL